MTVDDAAVGTPLHVEGTYNLRDVGGYAAAGGRQTMAGRLFRSDALGGLTDEGRRVLEGLGLRRIVDLRSDPEIDATPSALGSLDIETHSVSVLRAAAPSAQGGRRHTLDRLYQLIIDRRGQQLTEALRSVISASGPVLVHCTAGKDRTGVVVALALDAVGVDRSAIVADYAASERNLAGEWVTRMLPRIGAGWELSQESTRQIVTTSPAPTMQALLEYVDTTHGGSVAYLQAQGMSFADLGALRERLTVAQG